MNLNLTIAMRVGLGIVAGLGAATSLYLGRSIFVPLVIAILLASLLWPFTSWLNAKLKFSWPFSVFVAIGGLLLLNALVFTAFAVTIPRVLQEIPRPSDETGQSEIYDRVRDKLSLLVPDDDRLSKVFPKEASNSSLFEYARRFLGGEYITTKLVELSQSGLSWFVQSLLILFILLFLLLEGGMLGRRIKEIFGTSSDTRERVAATIAEMAEAVRTYLIWRTLVNVGLGIFLGIVYQVVGLSEPWTWALFTMVLCYVPYIGTLIAGVPPILDAFFSISPWAASGILLFYMMVVTFEGYVIVPVVMGRSMSLNATTVLLTCLFWDLVWGTPGLFLAMPIMAAVKAVLLHVDGYEVWGNLMSTEESAERENAKMLAQKIVRDGPSFNDQTEIIEVKAGS